MNYVIGTMLDTIRLLTGASVVWRFAESVMDRER